jgi:hypothetical protein
MRGEIDAAAIHVRGGRGGDVHRPQGAGRARLARRSDAGPQR